MKIGRQSGFSIIEVLISIVILSVGLLGIAAVQTLSLRNIGNADARSQASMVAYELVERMRVDAPNRLAYAKGMADGCPPPSAAWCQRLQQVLPDAEYSVIVNALPPLPGVAVAPLGVIIDIQWQERVAQTEDDFGNRIGERQTRFTLGAQI